MGLLRKSLQQNGVLTFKQGVETLRRYPELEQAVPLDVDESGNLHVDEGVLREMLINLNDAVVQESLHNRATAFAPDPLRGDSLQRGTAGGNTLKLIGDCLPNKRHSIDKLWDPDADDYSSDPSRIANLLKEATRDRQGQPRGDTTCGEELLAQM